jgi:ABC-type transporter Mla maintaining outer membrane lipid asymmetry ATPase subunit MlaF
MYDEPFAGLDPISLGLTASLIRNLNDALGATTIIVSHDVHETFQIADYVYFIANGRIAAEGTPEAMRGSMIRSCASSFTPRRTARCRSTMPVRHWPMISA